jgi:membrane protein implicated in regulation of membrane protease activity
MDGLIVFYSMHPFWAWLAFAALLLAVEMATGTGYLLWPAASAAVIGVLSMVLPLGLPVNVLIFAVLTIATTVLARRYLPASVRQRGVDINDRAGRLVGRFGEIVGPFAAGQGRVFVDGAEWTAEIDEGSSPPSPGSRVEVVEVIGGGRLKVRAAA